MVRANHATGQLAAMAARKPSTNRDRCQFIGKGSVLRLKCDLALGLEDPAFLAANGDYVGPSLSSPRNLDLPASGDEVCSCRFLHLVFAEQPRCADGRRRWFRHRVVGESVEDLAGRSDVAGEGALGVEGPGGLVDGLAGDPEPGGQFVVIGGSVGQRVQDPFGESGHPPERTGRRFHPRGTRTVGVNGAETTLT